MEKIVLIIVFLFATLFATFTTQANTPTDMPQSVYDQIVTQVIQDKGYLDTSAVQEAIAQWQLQQPLPATDGVLVETGNCATCTADTQGTSAQFKKPRNVKVKAKKHANGKYPSVLKIKWTKPKKLAASIRDQYKISHYLIYISKDGQSYEILRKEAKYKKNGKLKKKQKIKFKDRTTGTYTVQVQAVYVPKTATAKSAQKSINKGASTGSISPWTPGSSFETQSKYTTVGQYTGAIHSCLNDNGFTDATLLTAVDPSIDCTGYNLQNADIDLMANLTNIRSIILTNNPAVTDISALANLNYLEYLDLSNNPNIIQPDFSLFSELITLKLANMGLTTVPDLSTNDLLISLNLNDNPITTGFDLLPSTLEVLDAKSTASNPCDTITKIDSLTISGSAITSIESCANIIGLRYLTINDAPNLAVLNNEVNVSIDSFAGFCGLTFNNTNLEILQGSRPINRLNLINNSNLQQLNTIKPAYDNGSTTAYPNLIPASVRIEGSDSMDCGAIFQKKSLIQTLPYLEMKGVRVTTNVNGNIKDSLECPLTKPADFQIFPTQCKPDPVTSIDVYGIKGERSRYITWTIDPNYDYALWGVTYFQIQGFSNSPTPDFIRNVSINNNAPVYTNNMKPVRYTIKACTNEQCGDAIEVIKENFKAGINTVNNVQVNYQAGSNQDFDVFFSYRVSEGTDDIAKPTRFEVYSNINSGFNSVIDCSGMCDTINYNLLNINNQGLGSELQIKACNDTLGCGASTAIDIRYIVTSSDLPVPIWVLSGYTFDSNGKFRLIWNFPQDTANTQLSNVDYVEITEWKPKGIENSSFGISDNVFRYKELFYVENNKDLANTINRRLAMNRTVAGYYDYNIRSCKRDRVNGDVCSEYAGGIVLDETWNTNCANAYLQVDNCQNYSSADTADHRLSNRTISSTSYDIKPKPVISFQWIEQLNSNNKILVWDNPTPISNLNLLRPDYFYLEQTSGESYCNGNDKPSDLDAKIKINYADISHEDNLWVTDIFCENVGDNTSWSVKACINGQACSDSVSVTVGDPNSQSPNSTLHSANAPSTSSGGPGDFLPGMWWNKDVAGTGWHFYWASDLRYPSTTNNPISHQVYGNTYDLVGYWFAFKQDDARQVWTPTWFEVRLKQIDIPADPSNTVYPFVSGCFEGDILSSDLSTGVAVQTNVGNLQVCFTQTTPPGGQAANQSAILIFDVTDTSGLLTQETDVINQGPYESLSDGRLKLQINDFAIDIIGTGTGAISNPNNDDHYSGLWQNTDATVSMLTWLEKGLEVSTLALYDTAGDPIWFNAVNCTPNGSGGHNCAPSGEGYFDDYKTGQSADGTSGLSLLAIEKGFNPLGQTPSTYTYQGVFVPGVASYYGKVGRCLNPNASDSGNASRFFEAKLWYNVSQNLYASSGGSIAPRSVNSADASGTSCATSGIELTKKASLHDIRFFVNDNDETISSCDPNNANNFNRCNLSFTWYTDDDFPNIKAYYSLGGSDYQPLSTICNTVPQGSGYVVKDYTCDFTTKPAGSYTFQLRKDNYNGGAAAITIAQSRVFELTGCTSSACMPTILTQSSASVEAISGQVTNQPGAGPIPGSGGVSGGSATYNLPLVVPPGRNGMTPSLSVNYSSKGGNGILGVGWSLSVGSSIYRCPQTLAQDGVSKPVTLTNQDRLCLDGQRLMKISGANYFATGAEYRTEQDSFAKIVKTSTGFTVKTKSGKINVYQQNPTSGTTQKTTWSLVSESDTFGNVISYSYNDAPINHGTNEILLTKVTYSGSENREIKLTYSDRTDKSVNYLAGQRTDSTQKLVKIETFTPDSPLPQRTYNFDYNYSIATNRLILNTVTEQPKSSTSRILLKNDWSQDQADSGWSSIKQGVPTFKLSKAEIQFNENQTTLSYQQADSLLKSPTNNSPLDFNTIPTRGNRLLADFDGDGIKEVLVSYIDINNNVKNELHSYKLQYNINGNKEPKLVARIDLSSFEDEDNVLSDGLKLSKFADFNNDGRTDFIFKDKTTNELKIAVWKTSVLGDFSTGSDISTIRNLSDFFEIKNTSITPGIFSYQLVDYNNDGVVDISYSNNHEIKIFINNQTNSGTGTNPIYNFLFDNLNPNYTYSQSPNTGCYFNIAVMDINNDGVQDIKIKEAYGGTGNTNCDGDTFLIGMVTPQNNVLSYTVMEPLDLGIENSIFSNNFSRFMDINGDGLPDFVYVNDEIGFHWYVQMNTGNQDLTSSTDKLFSPAIDTGSSFGIVYTDCNQPSNTSSCSPRYAAGMKIVDIDNDGVSEMLLPDPDNVLVNHCTFFLDRVTNPQEPYDWIACSNPNEIPMSLPCDNPPLGSDDCLIDTNRIGSYYDYSNYHENVSSFDGGIYGYKAYKFIFSGTTIAIQINDNINLFAGFKNNRIHPEGDYLGDGLLDTAELLGCTFESQPNPQNGTSLNCTLNQYFQTQNDEIDEFINSYYNGSESEYYSDLDKGISVFSINQAVMPDMLIKVSKPFKDSAGNAISNIESSWNYYPLSTVLPERDANFQLYSIPDTDRYVDEDGIIGDHFYFNSSMYVVSEMRQTNNYGNNAVTEYAYEEAVYNNKGRGFQGFRKIKVRSRPDDSAEGLIYETLSESTFHQVFPYAGKLEKIEMYQQGVKVQQEDYTYVSRTGNISTNASNGVHYHPLTSKTTKSFEINNGNLISESTTTIPTTSYDDYGNITNQTTTQSSYLPSGKSRQETTVTTNVFDTADISNWWVDKLSKTTVTKSLIDDRIGSPSSFTQHTTKSSFFWLSGSARKLLCQYTYTGTDPASCSSAINDENTSRNSFSYDNFGNITNVSTTAYDAIYASAQSRSVTTQYTADGYFPSQITKAGLTTTFEDYDKATGQVKQSTSPQGIITSNSYDAFGFQTQQSNAFEYPEGNHIPIKYTAIRNCATTTPCSTMQIKVNSIKASNTYGDMIVGTPQLTYYTEQRQNGQPHVLTFYDNANNPVITQTTHSDGITNYAVTITSPIGIAEISTQPFTTTASAYPTINLPDAQGRIIEKVTKAALDTDATPCILTTTYSHNGSQTSIIAANTNTAQTEVDMTCTQAGNQSNLPMSRLYDSTGKLLSTTDADTNTVKYWYDASGNPLILQDAQGNQIVTQFDALGRKQSVNDPNMGNKTFQYNGFGEVIQQTDAENHHVFYKYDNLGRIKEQQSNFQSYSTTPLSDTTPPVLGNDKRSYHDEYIYNSTTGLLTQAQRYSNRIDPNKLQLSYNKVINYDEQNRPIEEQTTLYDINVLTGDAASNTQLVPTQYITTFRYDGNYNRLLQTTYNDRYSVANLYTKYGSLKQQSEMVNSSTTLMTIDNWNTRGQETMRTFGNGTSSQTSYYPSTGQVKQIINNSATGSQVLDYSYDYWGNIKTQSLNTSQAIENFTYDKLQRLTNAQVSGQSPKTYLYDAIGNITQKSDFSNAYIYGAGTAGPNAVTSATLVQSLGTISYQYDARGNRISDSIDGVLRASYQYDYNNLLIEAYSTISNGDEQKLEFNYGPDNQRYRKYDENNHEITLYANKDYEQVYKNGYLSQYKYYITSYLTITNGISKSFMQKDRLGSTTQILDETGQVLHTKSYDAFGKPRNGDWTDMTGGLFQSKLDFNDPNGTIDLTKRGFTDHEHLDEMQLIHMNGRMYDYNNGRFLSVDPFIQAPTSTQSMNPYTYIFNNPLSGTDPTGYICKECGGDPDRKTGQGLSGDWRSSAATGNGIAIFTKNGLPSVVNKFISDLQKQVNVIKKGADGAKKAGILHHTKSMCDNSECRANYYRGVGDSLLAAGRTGAASWFYVAADVSDGVDLAFQGGSFFYTSIAPPPIGGGFAGPGAVDGANVILSVNQSLEAYNRRNALILQSGNDIPGLENLRGLDLANAMGAMEQVVAQKLLNKELSRIAEHKPWQINNIKRNINEHFNGRFDRLASMIFSFGRENSKSLNSLFPANNFDFFNKENRIMLAVDLFKSKFNSIKNDKK